VGSEAGSVVGITRIRAGGIAMLAAGKRIAEQDERLSEQDTRIARLQAAVKPTPSTPSGMIPV